MTDTTSTPATTPTTDETRIDALLRDFQRACEMVVVRGDSHTSETSKERAILRNELRSLLLASRP